MWKQVSSNLATGPNACSCKATRIQPDFCETLDGFFQQSLAQSGSALLLPARGIDQFVIRLIEQADFHFRLFPIAVFARLTAWRQSTAPASPRS